MKTLSISRVPSLLMLSALASLSSCYRGELHRPVNNSAPLKQTEKNYAIESGVINPLGIPKYDYTVSYVEFGETGKYLDPRQAKFTMELLNRRASAARARGNRLLVVSYTHGWRHGSTTENVLQFRKLVKHAARSLGSKKLEVAGVYLAWPGAPFGDLPSISNSEQLALPGSLLSCAELPSYMDRKDIAGKLSAGGNDYTIFLDELSMSFAHHRDPNSFHIAIGHSLGAFILENSLIAPYVTKPDDRDRATPDLVFTMNSAAPASLSQRIVKDYKPAGSVGRHKVRFVSITSNGDRVTKVWANIGNAASDIFWNHKRHHVWKTNQTPGHDDSLLTTELMPVEVDGKHLGGSDDADSEFLIHMNLYPKPEPDVTRRPLRGEIAAFDKKILPGTGRDYHLWKVVNQREPWLDGRYVVLRTSEAFITGHGDIWSGQPVSLFCYYARLALSKEKDLPERIPSSAPMTQPSSDINLSKRGGV